VLLLCNGAVHPFVPFRPLHSEWKATQISNIKYVTRTLIFRQTGQRWRSHCSHGPWIFQLVTLLSWILQRRFWCRVSIGKMWVFLNAAKPIHTGFLKFEGMWEDRTYCSHSTTQAYDMLIDWNTTDCHSMRKVYPISAYCNHLCGNNLQYSSTETTDSGSLWDGAVYQRDCDGERLSATKCW